MSSIFTATSANQSGISRAFGLVEVMRILRTVVRVSKLAPGLGNALPK